MRAGRSPFCIKIHPHDHRRTKTPRGHSLSLTAVAGSSISSINNLDFHASGIHGGEELLSARAKLAATRAALRRRYASLDEVVSPCVRCPENHFFCSCLSVQRDYPSRAWAAVYEAFHVKQDFTALNNAVAPLSSLFETAVRISLARRLPPVHFVSCLNETESEREVCVVTAV